MPKSCRPRTGGTRPFGQVIAAPEGRAGLYLDLFGHLAFTGDGALAGPLPAGRPDRVFAQRTKSRSDRKVQFAKSKIRRKKYARTVFPNG